jgi:hypothetical protein
MLLQQFARQRASPCDSFDLWDFCNARQIFCAGHIAGRIFCSDVTNLQHAYEQAYLQQGQFGGVCMSIDTVLLILILTFAVGHALNKLDTSRFRGRRSGSHRGGISGRQT